MEPGHLIKTMEIFFYEYGYLAIFTGSLIEMSPIGWLVPGGTIVAIAGFYANGRNAAVLILTLLFGTAGSWIAFILSYLLGVKSGMWLVNKLNQKKNAAFAQKLLESHGTAILTTSMMANMTRFWVAYVAGVEKYKFSKFLKYSLIASFGWTGLLLFGGFLAGYEKGSIESLLRSIGIIGWAILALAIFVLHKSIKHEYKHYKEDTPHDYENNKQ